MRRNVQQDVRRFAAPAGRGSRIEDRGSNGATFDLRPSTCGRAGFTLVELLVASALVVLMMTLFATIFAMATGSMGTQKGLAENDQRARTLTTVIKGDLRLRTFRHLVPFDPADTFDDGTIPDTGDPELNALWEDLMGVSDARVRSGYFYISENDPANDSDDVLQFTVFDELGTLYMYGAATALSPGASHPNPNDQPEYDDGQLNGSSTSRAAEIVYFVRRGTLYRRVLLIREKSPDAQPGGTPETDNMFDPPGDYTGEFWRDFDFSATATITASGNDGAHFHGVNDLTNSTANVYELGIPLNRFGFDHVIGHPREYVGADPSDGTGGSFIGRYTQEETSHLDFNYPHIASTVPAANSNPMQRNQDPSVTFANGVVTEYRHSGDSRRAEDVLMTGVHSFDVKVWDDRMGQFVDIGHTLPPNAAGEDGDFHINRCRNPSYGPHFDGSSTDALSNRIFDTWSPSTLTPGDDDNGDSIPDAPYRPTVDVDSAGNPLANPEPKPLKAIQITVRYYDTGSGQLRQMTLVEQLTTQME